ncbi:probable iron/ascorbate oxidoreductase DDB_G0283291-like isoform X1 [Glycine max]|uniref:probable iron/ascorbate oxidoreductase DDB_G0283291-like isoform X1 n=1 Tax=Glycine max TaxID=3847 RepID=UPI0003DEC721|nr:probable iron/ascorbate oxidoreductase DDB_G0283291-like isoform X1 [Glycine max]|eukprot:XP_006572939.1 probable iron/ascorbate oxidoreductase DDB_G0283291-like isoform X2 [Glycine max]
MNNTGDTPLFLMSCLILKTKYMEITKRGIILELKKVKMIHNRRNLFMDRITGPHQMFCPGGGRPWKSSIKRHCMYREVGKAVAKMIALALDLDANYFDRPEILGEPIAILRLLHYEGQVSDPSKGLYGAGAHTDFGLITLLATDDVPGLQICKDRDAKPQKWEDVAPLKGAFIVNLGDMLERWSNCVFKSTLHRVLGNGQGRYSIAYFLEPSLDCLVECLPTCKSDSNPPKYPPILCHDYMTQRYKDTHADLNIYKKQQA